MWVGLASLDAFFARGEGSYYRRILIRSATNDRSADQGRIATGSEDHRNTRIRWLRNLDAGHYFTLESTLGLLHK